MGDALGKQGTRIVGDALSQRGGAANVWARPLADGSIALVFLNAGAAAADVKCDAACFKMMGYDSTEQFTVRDIWAHKAMPDFTAAQGLATENLTALGGHLMVVVSKKSVSGDATVLV